MKIVRFLAVLLCLVTTRATAADRISAISTYLEGEANSHGLNGNVLVAERGRILYARSFGYADFEHKRPNTPDTQFELASVSKVFTATAVLQLAEKGRLALDAPLAEYLPDFPFREITIRQILSHSSGLSEEEISATAYEKRIGRPLEMKDLPQAIAATGKLPKLKPGERWWYSNLGYELLARLVEVRSGERFDAYLSRHILQPAGMRHTYLRIATINPEGTRQTASNYDYPFRFSTDRAQLTGDKGYYNDRLYGPAHVISTTGDLLRLDRALRNGRLLTRKTLEEAYSPQVLKDGSPVHVWLDIGHMGDADDGLGWFIFRDKSDGRIVWHTGGTPGTATIFLRNLDRDQTVVIFDNTNSENLYRKALSVLRLLNGREPLATPRSLSKIYGRLLATKGEDAAFVALLANKDKADRFTLTENDLNNLGYQFAEQGHRQEALATFRAALTLWPTSDNLMESYGEILEQAGRADDAQTMYRRAVSLNPKNSDALARLHTDSPPTARSDKLLPVKDRRSLRQDLKTGTEER